MTDEVECIYTIIESEYTLPDFDMIHRMVQWAHKYGLEPAERVYANDMTSFLQRTGLRTVWKFICPLRGLLHRYNRAGLSGPSLSVVSQCLFIAVLILLLNTEVLYEVNQEG